MDTNTCMFCSKSILPTSGFIKFQTSCRCTAHLSCSYQYAPFEVECPKCSTADTLHSHLSLDATAGMYAYNFPILVGLDSLSDQIADNSERFDMVRQLEEVCQQDQQNGNPLDHFRKMMNEFLIRKINAHNPIDKLKKWGVTGGWLNALNISYDTWRNLGYTVDDLIYLECTTEQIANMDPLNSKWGSTDTPKLLDNPILLQYTQYYRDQEKRIAELAEQSFLSPVCSPLIITSHRSENAPPSATTTTPPILSSFAPLTETTARRPVTQIHADQPAVIVTNTPRRLQIGASKKEPTKTSSLSGTTIQQQYPSRQVTFVSTEAKDKSSKAKKTKTTSSSLTRAQPS